jgi:carbon-monoxide dehydrogenase small subunit
VRLELSGNLCRCTGYAGIVRAIRRVLDAQREQTTAPIQRATAAATA